MLEKILLPVPEQLESLIINPSFGWDGEGVEEGEGRVMK